MRQNGVPCQFFYSENYRTPTVAVRERQESKTQQNICSSGFHSENQLYFNYNVSHESSFCNYHVVPFGFYLAFI
jgi:hypothetical protein